MCFHKDIWFDCIVWHSSSHLIRCVKLLSQRLSRLIQPRSRPNRPLIRHSIGTFGYCSNADLVPFKRSRILRSNAFSLLISFIQTPMLLPGIAKSVLSRYRVGKPQTGKEIDFLAFANIQNVPQTLFLLPAH